MEKSIKEQIADNYKLIMWGVLISAAHIIIWRFQILPAFIGYIMVYIGISNLFKKTGIKYMKGAVKSAGLVMIVSIVHWIFGAFVLPYTNALTQCIELLVFVLELSLLGEFLNKTVKLLKENDKVSYADKMRKNRMLFIKFYIAVVAVYALSMIPKLDFLGLYAAPTLMLSVKIFVSLILQTVIRSEVEYYEKQEER